MIQRDVLFATTNEGHRFPILDLTHQAFKVRSDPAFLDELLAKYAAADRRQRRVPTALQKWLMRNLARRSPLMKALIQPESDHFDGLSTYVIKLGDKNLPPPFDGRLEKRIAGSPHALLTRVRMQQIAGMMADTIRTDPLFRGAQTLHFLNIAGGPAFDSINALLALAQDAPELLDRRIEIQVLDLASSGAAFGRASIAELTRPGGPLAGVDVTLNHIAYDWNDTRPLEAVLETIRAQNGLALLSSEGGLFEYASDAAVVDNLTLLAQFGDVARYVYGSVTVDATTIANAYFTLQRRGLRGFIPIASAAGWELVTSNGSGLSHQVCLRPMTAN